jgi:hypothetical protein
MVDKIEVTVTDLAKKHLGKPAYKGFYSLAKHIYQDDGVIVSDGFALDKEALEVLRAKIMAILFDEIPIKVKETYVYFNH